MTLRFKNIIYTLGLLSAVFLVWHFRKGSQSNQVILKGETMGTTYSIAYFDDEKRDFKASIDSLLEVFNNSLSTYIPTSEVSQFNHSDSLTYHLPYFLPVLSESLAIVQLTDGAFDPTIMPLVNAWGFGTEQVSSIDSALIDSVKQYVGFDKFIQFDDSQVTKTNSSVQLDFSALAKGYGVDVVADWLSNKNIENFFVEIGGEVITKGNNLSTESLWKFAILHPESQLHQPKQIAQILLADQAMATSANNFNYRIIEGVKYSHTISPFTGYPIHQKILSATIIAPTCMRADALATACMVMGHKQAISFIENQKYIHGFIVYSNESGGISTYISPELDQKITLN